MQHTSGRVEQIIALQSSRSERRGTEARHGFPGVCRRVESQFDFSFQGCGHRFLDPKEL